MIEKRRFWKSLMNRTKILFFIESLGPGGKERRLSQLISGLATQNKYEMEIVLTKNEIHYTSVRDERIKIHMINKSLGFGKNGGVTEFYKICKKFKPDLIHTWGGQLNLIAIPTALRMRIPIVNGQVTATTPKGFKELIIYYKIPFLFSKVIVSNSVASKKVYGIPKRKYRCIYNGFELERLDTVCKAEEKRKELKIENPFLISMVASYNKAKDHQTVIQAATELLQTRRDITFLFAGGGDFERLQSIIPKELLCHFMFLNHRNDTDDIINASDICILSSHNEGFPNAVVEYMAFGKPAISTMVGGVPELITDGKDGLLFDVGNYKTLYSHIEKLLNDRNFAKEISIKAAKKIATEFNLPLMIEKYENLYQQMI